MKSKSILFRIEKCQNPPDDLNFCKSDTQIKEFINEVSVQLWVIESKMDVRYFSDKS